MLGCFLILCDASELKSGGMIPNIPDMCIYYNIYTYVYIYTHIYYMFNMKDNESIVTLGSRSFLNTSRSGF